MAINGYSRERARAYITGRLHSTLHFLREHLISERKKSPPDFFVSLRVGEKAESLIDDYLNLNGDVVWKAPLELQRYGVDRICMRTVGDLPIFVSLEYKADFMADKTGNLFIETQIRQSSGTIVGGWFRNTISQKILFFVPGVGVLISVDTEELRRWIFENGMTLRHSHWVENKGGFAGRGILLPLDLGRRELKTWHEINIGDFLNERK